jgi:hypothetical protein
MPRKADENQGVRAGGNEKGNDKPLAGASPPAVTTCQVCIQEGAGALDVLGQRVSTSSLPCRSHRRGHLTQPRTTRGYGPAEREGSNPRRLRDRLCLLRAESADARARWPRFFGLVVLRRRDDGYGDERDPSASKEDRYSVREPPDTARALADRPTTPDEAAGREGSYSFSRLHRADTTTNARMAPGSPGPSGRPGCRGSGGAVPRRL